MRIRRTSVLFGLVCVIFLTAACTLAPDNQGGGGGGGGGGEGSSSSISSQPAGAATIAIGGIKDPCLTNTAVLDIQGTASNKSGTIKGIELILNETGIVNVSIPAGQSACAWETKSVNLTPGQTNTVAARMITGDNKTNTTAPVRVIADTLGPVLGGFLPENDEKVAAGFSVSGKWEDQLSGIAETKIYVMRTDLPAPAVYQAESDFYTNITVADKASYFIWTESKDQAGNWSVSKTNTVHVEDLPVVFIDSPADEGLTALTNSKTAVIAGRYESAWYQIKKIIVLVNGITNNAVFDSKTWNCPVTLEENRTNLIEAVAVNNMDWESQTKFIRIIEDSTAPVLTIQGLPQYTNNNNLSLNVSALDGLSGLKGIYYQLDDSPEGTVSGISINLTGLGEGQHNITVWAADNAGNTSAAEILSTFIDTKAPLASIAYPTHGTMTNTNIMNIAGTTNESAPSSGIKSFRILLNGIEQTVESGWTVRNAVFNENAENIITAEIEDNAGNKSTSTSLVTIDTTPPEINLNVPSKAGTNAFKITTDISDTLSGVKAQYYSLDGGSDVPFTGTNIAFAGLSLGAHSVSVWAVDNLGNTSAKKQASFTVLPSDADLKGLSIDYVTISPKFDPKVLSYSARVWDSLSSVTVRPAADDTNTNVTVAARVNGSGWQTVVQSAGAALPLNMGNNTIEIKVTAQDGMTEKIYTVSIFRKDMNAWTEKAVPGSKAYGEWRSVCMSQDGTKIAAASWDYLYVSSDSGKTFKQVVSAGRRYWASVTMTYDGSKMAAVDLNGGNLFLSADGGGNWLKCASIYSNNWTSVAMSADGGTIALGATNGYLTYSTNGGSTWRSYWNGNQQISSVCVSSNGLMIAGCINYGYFDFFVTTNAGYGWYMVGSGKKSWYGISLSADGSRMAAVNYNEPIYVSTNYGITMAGWTALSNSGLHGWQSVSISGDGRTILGAGYDYLYVSSDYGSNWVQKFSDKNRSWEAVFMTQDGLKQIAASFSGDPLHLSSDGGSSWNSLTDAGYRSWRSVKMSPDGTKLAAVSYNTSIFTSSDGGNNWMDRSGSGVRSWEDVCISADGMKMAACAYGSNLVMSWDGGATWTDKLSGLNYPWNSICMTPDGQNIFSLSTWTNYFCSSSDGGVTWNKRNSPTNKISYVAVSDDASVVAVGGSGYYIYISTNGGTNWVQQTGLGYKNWRSISMTGDGRTIFTSEYNGYLYLSTNRGSSWSAITSAGNIIWSGQAVSADGNMIAAIQQNGYIITSADGGKTWQLRTIAGKKSWSSITMSADGMTLAACAYPENNIFMCQ